MVTQKTHQPPTVKKERKLRERFGTHRVVLHRTQLYTMSADDQLSGSVSKKDNAPNHKKRR